jgi:hypothetical protein
MRYKVPPGREAGGFPAVGNPSMEMHQMFKAIVAAVLALGLGAAHANPSEKILAETDAAKIVQQQTEVQFDVKARRGAYRDMEGRDRERLLLVQQRVINALEGRVSTNELAPTDRIALFNDLEEISALVNKAEDERMVCERTRPIGSNRPVNICKTVAERRLEREQSLRGRDGVRDCPNCAR